MCVESIEGWQQCSSVVVCGNVPSSLVSLSTVTALSKGSCRSLWKEMLKRWLPGALLHLPSALVVMCVSASPGSQMHSLNLRELPFSAETALFALFVQYDVLPVPESGSLPNGRESLLMPNSPTRGQGKPVKEQGGLRARLRELSWAAIWHLMKDLCLLKGSWGRLSSLQPGLMQERCLLSPAPRALLFPACTLVPAQAGAMP